MAVLRIDKYILATADRGIKFTPNNTKGMEYYVDADFVGVWDKSDANNPENISPEQDKFYIIVDAQSYGLQSFKQK